MSSTVYTPTYEPNLEIHDDVASPDSYIHGATLLPPDNFVISRHRDGSVASIYSDPEWNFSAYHARGYTVKLAFSSWCSRTPTERENELIGEMKWLMFLLIWKRSGPPLAVSTLRHYMQLMRILARVARESQCSIYHILNSPVLLQQYIRAVSGNVSRKLPVLLRTLIELGEPEIGFPVLGGKTLDELQAKSREYKEQYKQHPPIPTRLYSKLIQALAKELDDFETVADRYLAVVGMCAADVLVGRSYEHQHKRAKRLGMTLRKKDKRPSIAELFERYGLTHYAASKEISNMKGFARCLSEIQTVCKLIILVFSGMRSDEAASLPFYCLEESTIDGEALYKIVGSTTKLNGGREQQARWVTSVEAAKAIRVAQNVAAEIYKFIGVTPKSNRAVASEYPLFVTPTYLPFLREQHSTSRRFATTNLHLSSADKLLGRIDLTIAEQDLRELEQIDLHRAWRSEPQFRPGDLWSLTAHQLRRSLALYASSSGLVSLPTLRRQLKHITQAMSRYYASGSAFAKDIIGEKKDHFGREYQRTQPESQALSYITDVLLSDERLFGPHGVFVERNIRNKRGVSVLLNDRDSTVRKFKKGEIAFKETALGGCTEVKPCDKKALRSIISCLDCSRAVIKASKLDRVILAQETLVSRLEKNTMMWGVENTDLEILQRYRAGIKHRPKSEVI